MFSVYSRKKIKKCKPLRFPKDFNSENLFLQCKELSGQVNIFLRIGIRCFEKLRNGAFLFVLFNLRYKQDTSQCSLNLLLIRI